MLYPAKVKILLMALLIISVTGSGANVFGAKKVVEKTKPELRTQWYAKHVRMKSESLFKNLNWQFIGPTNVSGRMTDVAVVEPKGKFYTIFVAGASGGVWKTENEGVTWQPVFEHGQSTAIGDIAIAPSDQKIIWIGTGEANIFRSSQAGAGVYKSLDGGETWTHMGLTDTNTIPRIIIHPKNPDIVYVAAAGHEWTNNSARGLYKTINGGQTWEKIFYINDNTGANDLIMDPQDPNTLYLTMWQRIRLKWNDPRNEAGYTGSGIHRSRDGGKTWQSVNTGLPAPKYRGRIGIDLCRSKPNILYAFVDNYEIAGEWEQGTLDSYGRPKGGKIKGATVYKSTDHGSTWIRVSQENRYMEGLSATYGWVFGQIRVDPNYENRIYVMGLALNVSDDSGKTFRRLPGMHGDHHGLWIDPENSDYLVNVNDGGVAVSYDAGKNWRTFYNNLPLVQFFNVMYDMADPFHVYGSIQDHGSYKGVVDLSTGRHNIKPVIWESAPGGEGSSHAIDPTDPNVVYSAGFYGTISRTDLKKGETKRLVPIPGKGEAPYRGQWVAPFIISPHNPRIIYHGMNYLFRSMDRGDSWERISRDLTYNRKNMLGDIPYQTIFSISESPLKFGLIYAGTDDGRVHVTKNSGQTWQEISKGLSYGKWISRVIASRYKLSTVYLTQNGKRDDDFAPYIWRSDNYGRTWENISANMPSGPVNVIREDPKNRNILYVGTDFGVYVSLDQGKSWQVLSGGLPTTYVHDLVIHPRDNIMVIATHGRGMYALDITYIQNLSREVMGKEIHLFKTPDAKIPKRQWWYWIGGRTAYISFYLAKPGEVNLKITGSDGKTVMENKISATNGLNFIEWDLKQKGANPRLPYVKAGKYKIRVKSGNNHLEEIIEVIK